MDDIIELLIVIVVTVTILTVIYRLLPFKAWTDKKPKFVLFPKYIASFDKPVNEIKSSLENNQFVLVGNNRYSRGKFYGDFSANAIKLSVDIDEDKKQVKVYASFWGILFDTGDIWKVTSDIIHG